MLAIQQELRLKKLCYAVFDRYYYAECFIQALLQEGHHVIVRARFNAVCVVDELKGKVLERAKKEIPVLLTCPWDGVTVKVVAFDALWEPLQANRAMGSSVSPEL